MKKLFVLFLSVSCLNCLAQSADVDPTIGNIGQLLEPTRPTASLPNQPVRMYPIRKDYLDDQITCFPLTAVSHRLGEVFALRPTTKPVAPEGWSARMPYDHDLEITRPWYYRTFLLDDNITVEFAPGRFTGYYRFTFPANSTPSLLLDMFNDGESSWNFATPIGSGDPQPAGAYNTNYLQGMETWQGNVKVYMYGTLTLPGTANTIDKKKSSISFPEGTTTVGLRYAISFISAEQAKKNYNEEIKAKSFDQVKQHAESAWSAALSRIKVEGGTPAQRRSFYTALYRCYERMVDITEDGQYFSGYDHKIESDSRPFYVDDWSWDTYLALHPLREILHPAQEEDMLQSYVRMYRQSGWMPTFPVLFGDYACMNGFHSSIIFLDAWRKGLHNFDVAGAYEGMRKNATDATLLPWRNGPKTPLDDFYHEKGYFPALHPGEKEPEPSVHPFEKRQAVAVTLGAAFDDWALAQLAKDLNKTSDYQLFAARGRNYANLWNGEKKFFLPRDAQGNWIDIDPKFDGGPGGRDYYDENNGWTYMWQVQQDIPDLINLMGGKQAFQDRLDQLFREELDRGKNEFWNKFPDATGLVGQFSMANEPSFHIPYLYDYVGAPWKTQQKIRLLLSTYFPDNVYGIPGDEDGGGMSAFVVFSSMGFYPVTPGLPQYAIGSPVFTRITIDLDNGKQFTIIAHNSSTVNKYIQRAHFNGAVLQAPWFTHRQLTNGGALELEMGPKPNKLWGANAAIPAE
jgi:predicted alpha-1,2-mannosidase